MLGVYYGMIYPWNKKCSFEKCIQVYDKKLMIDSYNYQSDQYYTYIIILYIMLYNTCY